MSDSSFVAVEEMYLPEYFSENRAHVENVHAGAAQEEFGLWLFDEDDESFQKALHALHGMSDVFNDLTDNELDISSTSSTATAMLPSTTTTSHHINSNNNNSPPTIMKRFSRKEKKSNNSYSNNSTSTAAELQAKMNVEMAMHLAQMDMSNPANMVFSELDSNNMLIDNEMGAFKRLRVGNLADNNDYGGMCLPVGKVPSTSTSVKRCEEPDCYKFPQGSTKYCISHGGGRRCTFENCTKGARDRYFCAAHGGGRRCSAESCQKSAVGGSHLCATHGGGRKCNFEGCTKSAQSPTPFCVMHGGGRKCSQLGCSKVARGKTPFCASHGGGARCDTPGCVRAAANKQKQCRAHLYSSFPASEQQLHQQADYNI